MCAPNLFDYATKELSQDAVICWLIAQAQMEPRNESARRLRDLGRSFVDALLAKHGAELVWECVSAVKCPEKVKILTQETVVIDRKRHSMDVLACMSDESGAHVLLIEDKINGDGDIEQLERYFEILTVGRRTKSGATKTTKLGNVSVEDVRAIYLKTGNHSRVGAKEIERRTRFKTFSRQDFLSVLETYHGEHPVVKDFKSRLQRWEEQTDSYRNWERDDWQHWSWRAWEGLYRRLERDIDVNGWGYVPVGDFLGLWWHSVPVELDGIKCNLYLQLEVKLGSKGSQKLCFKVSTVEETDKRKSVRDACKKAVLEAGKHSVVKPARLGVGKTMTVAVWNGSWIEFANGGAIDLNRTMSNLNGAEEIIDAASRML